MTTNPYGPSDIAALLNRLCQEIWHDSIWDEITYSYLLYQMLGDAPFPFVRWDNTPIDPDLVMDIGL